MVYIPDGKIVKYKKFIPPPLVAGDIAYWDGSAVQLVSKTKWNASLGTPVGVVVIPSNMLPDGRARILTLKGVDSSGNAVDSLVGMTWGIRGTETVLTNYDRVPTTDNSSNINNGSGDWGKLPSDNFSLDQSFVDPKAKYAGGNVDDPLIASPYLGDDNTLNPAYYEAISGYNNALSDFNGLSNTQTLVSLGSNYVAANAAWKYKDGVSNLQWYLPAMGELGFMIVRRKEINNTLSMLGAISLPTNYVWSSSEYSAYETWGPIIGSGKVDGTRKDYNAVHVRPFALI